MDEQELRVEGMLSADVYADLEVPEDYLLEQDEVVIVEEEESVMSSTKENE